MQLALAAVTSTTSTGSASGIWDGHGYSCGHCIMAPSQDSDRSFRVTASGSMCQWTCRPWLLKSESPPMLMQHWHCENASTCHWIYCQRRWNWQWALVALPMASRGGSGVLVLVEMFKAFVVMIQRRRANPYAKVTAT